ncbi:MAG TPA: class IV adenylate cyclase [Tepidisphaeraceae bacterium]|nr:class IV adenylate cyclase [Tepidisphaeraceae bacterium]
MGLEIEAKMKVDDLQTIRLRLEAAGAVLEGQVMETNTFFDTPDGKLRQEDKGLRLRANCDHADGEVTHVVTFKGPRQPGALKTRPETEFTVDDPHAAAELFESLGYGKTLTFQKRRQTWQYLGCKVELDELPHLGVFVEVEGPTPEKVMHARQALGLADQPIIKTGYIALLMNYLTEHHIAERQIELER